MGNNSSTHQPKESLDSAATNHRMKDHSQYQQTTSQNIINSNNNQDENSQSYIFSLFMANNNKEYDPYLHKYQAYGDDDYGCITHLRNCNKKNVFIGNFQCFAYDEKFNKYYSWGLNNYGQLGQGIATNYLSKNNSQYHFHNTFGEAKIFNGLKQLIKIQMMSFGDGFTVAADNNNSVFSWGLCEDYQLGVDLKFSEVELVNGKKCKLNPVFVFQSSSKITCLESGKDFTFVVNSDRHVFAWGSNNEQQILPHNIFDKKGKSKIYHYPKYTYIEELSDLSIISLKCGWSHTIALCTNYGNKLEDIDIKVDTNQNVVENEIFDEDLLKEKIDKEKEIFNENRVIIWGAIENTFNLFEFYEVGLEKENPLAISSGFSHCLILTGLNNVFAIGDNTYGQCGANIKECPSFKKPVKLSQEYIQPSETVCKVRCGAYNSLLLLFSQGWRQIEIEAFGHNYNREIGNYDNDFINNPVRFGYNLDEGKLKLVDVMTGNGITVIKYSDDKKLFAGLYDDKNNESDHLMDSSKINMNDIELNQL